MDNQVSFRILFCFFLFRRARHTDDEFWTGFPFHALSKNSIAKEAAAAYTRFGHYQYSLEYVIVWSVATPIYTVDKKTFFFFLCFIKHHFSHYLTRLMRTSLTLTHTCNETNQKKNTMVSHSSHCVFALFVIEFF